MRLGDLDPATHLDDPGRKQRYVTTLFDTIAPRYDRFTRWFSFGMDGAWKRTLARWTADVAPPGDLVLDLACGTGDLLEAVGRAGAGGAPLAVGADPSSEMLGIARRRFAAAPPGGPRVRLVRADMMALPFPDGCAAAVTVGYGFRNTPDVRVALAEVRRVLQPGGRLLDLDFFQPQGAGWRALYLWYLRLAGRTVGRWWHGEPEAYGYIARSLEGWMTAAAFRRALGDAGFRVERAASRLGGGIGLHQARRD